MRKVFVLLLALLALTFAACGYSEADLAAARERGYQEGYADGLDAPRKVTRPASGTLFSGIKYLDSEITVTADSSYDYVVLLKDKHGAERVSFYVRAGDTVTVGVPSEYLYVYFASGKDWYGYGKGLMFGADTSYTKDDDALDFDNYTWEYTLYPVSDGNFSETPSNENEFF